MNTTAINFYLDEKANSWFAINSKETDVANIPEGRIRYIREWMQRVKR